MRNSILLLTLAVAICSIAAHGPYGNGGGGHHNGGAHGPPTYPRHPHHSHDSSSSSEDRSRGRDGGRHGHRDRSSSSESDDRHHHRPGHNHGGPYGPGRPGRDSSSSSGSDEHGHHPGHRSSSSSSSSGSDEHGHHPGHHSSSSSGSSEEPGHHPGRDDCKKCSKIRVITGNGRGKDEPVTQTFGRDSKGCRTIKVSCTTRSTGSKIFYNWFENGKKKETSEGKTTISRTLVCNKDGELVLDEPNSRKQTVDKVECKSAATGPSSNCKKCNKIEVVPGAGTLDIDQKVGKDAKGCTTVTVSCKSKTVGQEVFYFWRNDNKDQGKSRDRTEISRVLTCNKDGELELKVGSRTKPVDQVQCKSDGGSEPKKCTTCSPTIGFVDDPANPKINQKAGKDSEGCNTVTVTCSTDPTKKVLYLWQNEGRPQGKSEEGKSSITRELKCNNDGKFELKEGSSKKPVDQVECKIATAAPLKCATCGKIEVGTRGGGKDRAVTQDIQKNGDGCNVVILTCMNTRSEQLSFFWYNNRRDVGKTAPSTKTISQALTCNNNGELEFKDGSTTKTVDKIECGLN